MYKQRISSNFLIDLCLTRLQDLPRTETYIYADGHLYLYIVSVRVILPNVWKQMYLLETLSL